MNLLETVFLLGFVTVVCGAVVLVCGYVSAWAMKEDEEESVLYTEKR